MYNQKKKELDKNLEQLKPILKPIARDLYYNRKYEYENLKDEKSKKDADDIKNILRSTELKNELSIEDQLKIIMVKHDIKHPLRGEE